MSSSFKPHDAGGESDVCTNPRGLRILPNVDWRSSLYITQHIVSRSEPFGGAGLTRISAKHNKMNQHVSVGAAREHKNRNRGTEVNNNEYAKIKNGKRDACVDQVGAAFPLRSLRVVYEQPCTISDSHWGGFYMIFTEVRVSPCRR